jgi:hypothetical protein
MATTAAVQPTLAGSVKRLVQFANKLVQVVARNAGEDRIG